MGLAAAQTVFEQRGVPGKPRTGVFRTTSSLKAVDRLGEIRPVRRVRRWPSFLLGLIAAIIAPAVACASFALAPADAINTYAEAELPDFHRVEVPLVTPEMESKAPNNPVLPKAKVISLASGIGQSLEAGWPAAVRLRDHGEGLLFARRPSLVGVVELRL